MMKMRNYISGCFAILLGFILLAPAVYGQENEIAVLIGRLEPTDRNLASLDTIKAALDGSVTYQFNYANRIVDGGLASLHWELAITGAPNSDVGGANLLLPKNYSSLFFTPGLKLKLFPGGGISPYVVGGVGLARFKEGDTLINDQPNTGDRANTTWAFDYGGGIDFNLFPVLAIRGEVRDFVTGNPSFDVPFLTDKQHNIFLGIGLVFRW